MTKQEFDQLMLLLNTPEQIAIFRSQDADEDYFTEKMELKVEREREQRELRERMNGE